MKRTALFLIIAMFVCTLSVDARSSKCTKHKERAHLHPTAINLVENKGVVKVEFTVIIPKKFVGKKERYVFTPVLTDFNNVVPLTSIIIDGDKFDKVKSKNNIDEVDYKDALSLMRSKDNREIKYVELLDYQPWMESADLVCIQKFITKKEAIVIAEDIYAKGVKVTTVVAPPVINRISINSYVSDKSIINFAITSSVLDKDIWNNMREMVKMKMVLKQISSLPNVSIEHIHITASSSPDGDMMSNTELSHDRAKVLVNFLKEEINLTQDQLDKINIVCVDENWEGLKILVKESGMENKENVIKTLCIEDVKQRDHAMKALPQYNYIKHTLLPQLRSAGIHVFYKLSVEE